MRKLFFVIFASALFALPVFSQAPSSAASGPKPAATEKKKRGPVFRATKGQIKEVQSMLKDKKMYSGEATGKLDDATRTAIKSFQGDNGLKQTGTLNRATLEKMKIELNDSQKAIPVSPNSFASAEGDKTPRKSAAAGSSKRIIFRASKDQIIEAQKMMKSKGMYAGDESGKLDDATREGLKKYQAGNGLKATGTLNRATLEKMGIDLTEKQKANANK